MHAIGGERDHVSQTVIVGIDHLRGERTAGQDIERPGGEAIVRCADGEHAAAGAGTHGDIGEAVLGRVADGDRRRRRQGVEADSTPTPRGTRRPACCAKADPAVLTKHQEIDVAAQVDVGRDDGARDERCLRRERGRRDVGKRPVAIVAPGCEWRGTAVVAGRAANHQIRVAIVIEIDQRRRADIERGGDAGSGR